MQAMQFFILFLYILKKKCNVQTGTRATLPTALKLGKDTAKLPCLTVQAIENSTTLLSNGKMIFICSNKSLKK